MLNKYLVKEFINRQILEWWVLTISMPLMLQHIFQECQIISSYFLLVSIILLTVSHHYGTARLPSHGITGIITYPHLSTRRYCKLLDQCRTYTGPCCNVVDMVWITRPFRQHYMSLNINEINKLFKVVTAVKVFYPVQLSGQPW